ncbi:MAG: hypothetical protein AAFQ14_10375 [Cyanobacteria bacterium J06621_12]
MKQTNLVKGFQGFIDPVKCLNEIIQEVKEYSKIVEEEKNNRCEIKAWEKVHLADIETKRDLLIDYLERSFDERAKNFQSLFQLADQAISSGDNQQLSLTLQAVAELAKSSPFNDIANLSTVKEALDNPEYIWQF